MLFILGLLSKTILYEDFDPHLLLILGFQYKSILYIEGFDLYLLVIALLFRSLRVFQALLQGLHGHFEGYWLSLSLSFRMPPKNTKRKAAPLVTRRGSKCRSTQCSATAVDQPSETGVTRGHSVGGSQVGSWPEAPAGHSTRSQDVLPVLSSDIITRIVAHVTQEVTSQLAQAPAPTIVPDPAQPALRCSQPTTHFWIPLLKNAMYHPLVLFPRRYRVNID